MAEATPTPPAAPALPAAPQGAETAHGQLRGVVQADSRCRTVRIVVERRVKHPLFGKIMRRRKKLLVHDPEEVCREGDLIIVQQSRPISKRKSYVFVRKVEASARPEEMA